MSVHDPTTEPAQDPAALGEFVPDRVTVHRCPCSTRSVALHPADRAGRIVADPDWSEHQTVTCGQCGRYGRLDPDDPENATVVVLGRAPLPAGCRDCGAEHGEPCREPFCPGQDLLDPHPGLAHPADGEPAVSQAAALLGDVPSTTRIWRHWASQQLDPSSGRTGREAARSAVEATREARRLRRGLRRGPATVTAGADDGDVCELLEFLGGRGGTLDQQQAVFALRVVQGWGDSTAAELFDAAAVWRAEGRAPF